MEAMQTTETTETMETIRVSEVISALSYALDLVEGQPMGHSARSCILGMRIGAEIGLPVPVQADLYYSLLIKDAGCSSNASRLFQIVCGDEIRAKAGVKTTDWTRTGWESLQYAIAHVAVGKPLLTRIAALLRAAHNQQQKSCELIKIRCERGASVARRMGFSEQVAQGIHSLDEHWDGGGYPDSLRCERIPLFSRVALLSQTLEVFWRSLGPDAAIDVVHARSGTWFDPRVVRAIDSLARRGALWKDLASLDLLAIVSSLEPVEMKLPLTGQRIDNICIAFAEVIDAKSPFTYRHSAGVAEAAVGIAKTLGLSPTETTLIRRAALLHDIGKLSVPNSILEKPDKLDSSEWDIVKRHPFYSLEILRRIPGFGRLSEIAACHHERLDGKGYFRNFDADKLDTSCRIIAVADVYDALASARPYRGALPPETVFSIMAKDTPHALDRDCFEALVATLSPGSTTACNLGNLATVTGYSVPVPLAEEIIL